MRQVLFVSHANPEDNEFAQWLALQLAREGYAVWCDLTQLLGGERFWDDIEDAIRHKTAKFLYVLSRTSNDKPGARNELALALGVQRSEKLKDFVVLLCIDSLPPGEFNVEVLRINAVNFRESWASGLAKLLEKLELDGVPKTPGFGPESVTKWWRDHAGGTRIIQQKSEMLASNWYCLAPTTLFFHELERDGDGSLTPPDVLPYPAVPFNQYLVSFAPAADFQNKLGPNLRISNTVERVINGEPEPGPRMWSFRDERSTLTNLLRQLWNHSLAERAFPVHEFSNKAKAFYFKKDQIENDTIWFTWFDGTKSHRQIIGHKTLKAPDGSPRGFRYWHFALEAKPTSHPVIGYTMKPRVLFSDDGRTIWSSNERLHRARRSQCKGWWNDKWRDLLLATMYWLNNGNQVALPGGSETSVMLSNRPLMIESPVSYDDTFATADESPLRNAADDDLDGELEETEEMISESSRTPEATS